MAEMGVRRSSVIAANLVGHDGHTRTDLDRTGLVRLPGVVPPEWLASARADVDGFLSRHGAGETAGTLCASGEPAISRDSQLAEHTYSPVGDRRADDPSAPLKLPPIHS